MDIEQKKQQLDEYGKILLGPGGFFENMPEDQKDVFGDALMLIAEIKAHEMIQEQMGGGFEINLNLPSINLDNLFSINPKPSYKEEYHHEENHYGCGNCGQDPCMCQPEGEWKCDACGSNPCMCGGQEYHNEEMAEIQERAEAVAATEVEEMTEAEEMAEAEERAEAVAATEEEYVDPAQTEMVYDDPAMEASDNELSEEDKEEMETNICAACNMEPCMCDTKAPEEPIDMD